jgi:hypothetical protein
MTERREPGERPGRPGPQPMPLDNHPLHMGDVGRVRIGLRDAGAGRVQSAGSESGRSGLCVDHCGSFAIEARLVEARAVVRRSKRPGRSFRARQSRCRHRRGRAASRGRCWSSPGCGRLLAVVRERPEVPGMGATTWTKASARRRRSAGPCPSIRMSGSRPPRVRERGRRSTSHARRMESVRALGRTFGRGFPCFVCR